MRDPSSRTRSPRVGNIRAMLQAMKPLHGSVSDPTQRKRRLLADLCRLIGEDLNGNLNGRPHAHANGNSAANGDSDLSPRLRQTLKSLLAGDSEKQVAAHMGLSQHTVHVYVKALYRRYGVSSRGELLARWVKKN